MGMNTAIKNFQILDNAYGILGIEFMAAAQALDFREYNFGKGVKKAHDVVRKHVAFLISTDRCIPTIRRWKSWSNRARYLRRSRRKSAAGIVKLRQVFVHLLSFPRSNALRGMPFKFCQVLLATSECDLRVLFSKGGHRSDTISWPASKDAGTRCGTRRKTYRRQYCIDLRRKWFVLSFLRILLCLSFFLFNWLIF